MFKAQSGEKIVETHNNIFKVDYFCKVSTINGFVSAYKLKIGDVLLFEDDTTSTIKDIVLNKYSSIILTVSEVV